MKLFGTEDVNTGRQFEFDFAKAVCVLGMVFIHCFEALSAGSVEESAAYYLFVTVLDAVFGAGTFMVCMGMGIAYSWKGEAQKLISRGLSIFLLAYLLNVLRDGIPDLIQIAVGTAGTEELLISLFCLDILQFAGLALMLFGILKKHGASDRALLAVALVMSAAGSFIRFIDLGHFIADDMAGLFFGTFSPVSEDTVATFPLLNWFIVVVAGYLYGMLLRRCTDTERYYRTALPVSAGLLALYLAAAIPNRIGMMCGKLIYYYQMTTPEVLVLLDGAVFATSLYHFISKPMSEGVRNVITQMSANLNTVYLIHWVIIGWLDMLLDITGTDGLGELWVFITGIVIFTVSNLLAMLIRKRKNGVGEVSP